MILGVLRVPTAAIFDTVGTILEALVFAVGSWIEEEVPEAYRAGQQDALDGARSAGEPSPGGDTPPEPSAPRHRPDVELLAENLYGDLIESVRTVGRQVADALREAGLEAALEGRLAGEGMAEVGQRLEGILDERGLAGLEDASGRSWSPEAYAGMAARTTLTEARNLGTLNQLEEIGEDLVQITEHPNRSCPICAKYEGRVYSISGDDPRYPPLRGTAFSVAYHTIHPRCRHYVTPYLEEFADDPKGDRERSNRPFVDDRPEAVKKAYDAAEARKRRARERRRKRDEEAA